MKHTAGRYFFFFGAAYSFGYAFFAAEKCR
jgi:hypothetical protein